MLTVWRHLLRVFRMSRVGGFVMESNPFKPTMSSMMDNIQRLRRRREQMLAGSLHPARLTLRAEATGDRVYDIDQFLDVLDVEEFHKDLMHLLQRHRA